jgi:hypothetical protein
MRPVPFQSSKRLFACLTLITLLFFFAVQQSCRKAEFYQSLSNADRSEHFFRTGSTNKKVLDIIAMLKSENENTGFVNKLPSKSGLPVWEKMIRQARSNSSAREGDDSSGNIIIPMTTNNEDLSSLIIVAERPDGTLDIQCKTTNEYLYSLTHGSPLDTASAMYDLNMFFYMEHRAFGTTRFYHIPSTLFPNLGTPDTHGDKTVIIKDDTTGMGSIVPIVWVCVEYLQICSVCHQNPCEYGYSYYYTICTPVGGGGGDPFPYPPNPPIPPPHGGGGGNTPPPVPPTTPPPPPPNPGPPPAPLPPDCLINTWYSFTNLPGDNCLPPTADTILNPCAAADVLAQSASFISYLQEIKDSLNSSTANNREFGYMLFRDAAGDFGNTPDSLLKGKPNTLGLPDFHNYYIIDVIMHSHFNTNTDSTRGLQVFSPDDLFTMCATFNVGNVKDPADFTMALVTPTTQYLLKIENLTKFRAWAQKFSAKELKFHYFDFRRRNILATNSAEENERLFSRFMEEYLGGSGLKLFRGTGFSNWQPIRYNTSTGNVENAPCQ